MKTLFRTLALLLACSPAFAQVNFGAVLNRVETFPTTQAVGDLWYASSATALSALADVATGSCLISGGVTTAPLWGSCGSGASLSTIQTWTAAQTFTNSDIKLLGSSTGATTFASANAGASNYTLTLPAVTDTAAVLGTAQTWGAAQTFPSTDIIIKGSSTGTTTIASANASATNYTFTLPALTDTALGLNQINTGTSPLAIYSTTLLFSQSFKNNVSNNILTTAQTSGVVIGSGFGTSPAISQNNGPSSFSVNVGTGGTATSGVVTLPAAAHAWACSTADTGTTPTGQTEQTATGTTSITLTNYSRTTGLAAAWTASEIIQVSCWAN